MQPTEDACDHQAPSGRKMEVQPSSALREAVMRRRRDSLFGEAWADHTSAWEATAGSPGRDFMCPGAGAAMDTLFRETRPESICRESLFRDAGAGNSVRETRTGSMGMDTKFSEARPGGDGMVCSSVKDSTLGDGGSTTTCDVLHVFCRLLFTKVRTSPRKSPRKTGKTKQIRSYWIGRVDCTFSLIAAVVGLGNLTHFPYMAHRHGAGTFLFPFILVTVLVTLPLFHLEACLGQLSGQGAVLGWSVAPLFKGLGISIGVTSTTLSVLYSVQCIYPLFYFGSSFINPLPWSHCKNPWNSKDCLIIQPCDTEEEVRLDNGTCYSRTTEDSLGVGNLTTTMVTKKHSHFLSANEYWIEKVEGTGEVGPIQGHLVACLFTVWLLCFLALARDVVYLGKIMIFSVLIMFLVLLLLVVTGALLPHASDGVQQIITPKWGAWRSAEVWYQASGESFYGSMVGTGVITTMTSYSRYSDGHPFRMSMAVVVSDAVSSIIATFVFFTRVGYLAYRLGESVELISRFDSAQLAYVVYPETILGKKSGPFMSIMFFLALSGVGITTQIATTHVLITFIQDSFPQLGQRQYLILLAICLLGFFLGLPFTLKGGSKWVHLLSRDTVPFWVLLNGLMEVLFAAWGYGMDNLYTDLEWMLGRMPSTYFRVCWKYIIPLYLLVLLVWALITKPIESDSQIVCRVLAFLPLLCLLLSILYSIGQAGPERSLPQRVKRLLLMPESGWTRRRKRSRSRSRTSSESNHTSDLPRIFVSSETPCLQPSRVDSGSCRAPRTTSGGSKTQEEAGSSPAGPGMTSQAMRRGSMQSVESRGSQGILKTSNGRRSTQRVRHGSVISAELPSEDTAGNRTDGDSSPSRGLM